jgi:hypothetical protein
MGMNATTLPELETHERRRAARAAVSGVAVLQSGGQPPSIWRVTNVSAGGVGLEGEGAMAADVVSLTLHVAGVPALELRARVLRRQVSRARGRAGLRFVGLTAAQAQVLRDVVAGEHAPSGERRRALVVSPDERRSSALVGELERLGHSVRREPAPGQALAWLLRDESEVLLVDEAVIEADRAGLLKFVRDVSPETRRLVIANDVRGFRLYYAMKAGLVDRLVEPTSPADVLARHLAGSSAD